MTIASFNCIPGRPVVRSRRITGSYNAAGDWVDPGTTDVQVNAVTHPVTAKSRLSERMIREIDGNRSRKWVVFYAPLGTFRGEDEANLIQADHIEYQNERFEVIDTDEWQSGILDHQKVLAARLDARDTD